MSQSKYTIFATWNDGSERHGKQCFFPHFAEEPVVTLADRVEYVRNYMGADYFVPIAWEEANSVSIYNYEQRIADAIAAGRVIKLIDGKYVPFEYGAPVGNPIEEKPAEEGEGLGVENEAVKSPLQTLRELVEVQGSDGNWNCDDYMLGMFNGMELALSIMEGREPQYRTLKPQAVAESTAKPALPSLASSPDLAGEWKPFEFGSAHLKVKAA